MTATRAVDRRSEIVRAAYRVLARQGYEATSIKDIAHEANIAPGLVHYYFASKEDLLVAVVEEASTVSRAQFAALREAGGGRDLATSAFELSLARLRERPHDHRLRFELFAIALHNPAVRAAYARVLDARRQNMAGIVRAVDPERPGDAVAFASVIAAAIDGIAIQTLADDRYDPAPAFRALGEMARLYGRALRRAPRPKRSRRK